MRLRLSFFFKQKTAYEMRISDWSSDVCSSDLVVFHAHQVEFHRRAHGLSATTTITIAHGDDLEIRRLSLVNDEDRPRIIEITIYAEIVLAPAQDAARHPAFSKSFVGAEALPGGDGLLFTRPPRNPAEHPPVMLHRVTGAADSRSYGRREGKECVSTCR